MIAAFRQRDEPHSVEDLPECYSRPMVLAVPVTSGELRDDTVGVLRRAAAGEVVEVTVNGEPVAELGPIREQRSHWMPKAVVAAQLAKGPDRPGTPGGPAALTGDTDALGPLS
jgi:prevent-host-death family protein